MASTRVAAGAGRRVGAYRRLYPYLLVAPALSVLLLVLVYPFFNGVSCPPGCSV